jgi:Chalcone isomerase-like
MRDRHPGEAASTNETGTQSSAGVPWVWIMKSIVSGLCLIVLTAAAASAQASAPPTLSLEGAGPVPLAGRADRADRLGTVGLYSLAFYIDGSIRDRSHVASEDVAKAVRIEITYKDDLRRWATLDWRPELLPRVEPGVVTHLQGAFAPLKNGDVVVIDYVPTRGTSVRVNRAVAVSGAPHDLMLAFLDHWIGQQPLSEEIKRALLAGV